LIKDIKNIKPAGNDMSTKKYETLVEMLNNEGYNVNELQDDNGSAYFILNNKNGDLCFTVFQEIDYLEIYIETFDDEFEIFYTVETKKYKQAKSAFNYLQKLL
jgi:hypothetical protein